MKTVFITATGTEVGKTYVTQALTRALTDAGRSVRVLKPVVTGYSGDGEESTDTEILLAAQGFDAADADAVEACSPWRFEAPLSPDMAAAREGREIDFAALVDFCRRPGGEDVRLIEGVGGALVPLTGDHTVLDWIVAVGAPALIIAGSYLGTLSHTLATAAALQARGAEIAGVVVDESEESPVPVKETMATLERFLGGVPVAAVARDAAPDAVLGAVEAMIVA